MACNLLETSFSLLEIVWWLTLTCNLLDTSCSMAPVKGPFRTCIKFRHVHLVLCGCVKVSGVFDPKISYFRLLFKGFRRWRVMVFKPATLPSGFSGFQAPMLCYLKNKVRNHGFTTNSCEQKHDLTTPIQSTWSPSCTTGRCGLGNPGGLLGKGKPGG